MNLYKSILLFILTLPFIEGSVRLLQSTASEKESIPRILWMHIHNVPGRDRPVDKMFDENISNIIQKYKNAWNNDESVEVHTLSTETCKEAISKVPIKGASTDLLQYFMDKDPSRYSCHLAVLFLYGGYYIQRTVEVIEPFIPPPGVTLAAVTNSDGSIFHDSFLAAAPYNSLIYRALKKYIAFAKGEYDRQKKSTSVYGEIMHSSYMEVMTINPSKKSSVALLSLQDLNELHGQQDEYKSVKMQDAEGEFCNKVVVDQATKKVYYYLLFPGASQLCGKVTESTEAASVVEEKKSEVMLDKSESTGSDASTEADPKIPHKLWFFSRQGITKGSQVRTHVQKHHHNIQNTVDSYKNTWDMSSIEYEILDRQACVDAIIRSPMVYSSEKLIDYFQNNYDDLFDFCRAIVLHEHGGYSFNEELEVVQPYTAKNNDISFVGVINPDEFFLPSFVAAMPQHPIIGEIIAKYVLLEDGKLSLDSSYPAMQIYRDAYNGQGDDIKSTSVLLQEKHLSILGDKYDVKSRGSPICNFVIFDSDYDVIHFFTRIFADGEYCA